MITRLITDEDILTGRVRSPIVLDAQTLLTPAAGDRAVAKGLVIVEKDGAAGAQLHPQTAPAPHAPQAASSCADAAWSGEAVEGLPDGLYLVRVEGGRVASCLPAGGPGTMTRARNL